MGTTPLHRIDRTGAADRHGEARRHLAAAFRWTARLDMHEGVANHFSLSVSDDGARFLMNPNGRHFSRIRASELLLLDANDPDSLKRPDAPDATAWGLHGGLHRKLPHARGVLHVHPSYATVLASMTDSTIYPIDQNAMRFYGRVAVDEDYGGMALGDEAERVCGLLGDKPVLMMGNHGVMVVAPTVARAFDELYILERACETLVKAYMTGKELRIASHEVAQRTCRQWQECAQPAENHFAELLAILDEEEPDYAD